MLVNPKPSKLAKKKKKVTFSKIWQVWYNIDHKFYNRDRSMRPHMTT